jgi:hypothetical protein
MTLKAKGVWLSSPGGFPRFLFEIGDLADSISKHDLNLAPISTDSGGIRQIPDSSDKFELTRPIIGRVVGLVPCRGPCKLGVLLVSLPLPSSPRLQFNGLPLDSLDRIMLSRIETQHEICVFHGCAQLTWASVLSLSGMKQKLLATYSKSEHGEC